MSEVGGQRQASRSKGGDFGEPFGPELRPKVAHVEGSRAVYPRPRNHATETSSPQSAADRQISDF